MKPLVPFEDRLKLILEDRGLPFWGSNHIISMHDWESISGLLARDIDDQFDSLRAIAFFGIGLTRRFPALELDLT